jgi:hypothetical protein
MLDIILDNLLALLRVNGCQTLLNLAGNWVRDHVPVHGLKTAEDNLGWLHSQSDVWGGVQNTLDNGKHYTPLPLNSAV